MSSVRQGLRAVGWLIAVGSAYLAIMRSVGQPAQIPILLGLLIMALGVEALWAVVRWLSPLRGTFGEPDQELALVRVMERELSRSLRHQAPLVIVAMQGRWNLTRRAVSAELRLSDIVMRGRGRHLLILMTETQLEQAQLVLERMVDKLPIRAVAMTNEQAVQSGAAVGGFGGRYEARDTTAHGPTLALLRGLQLGLFRAQARTQRDQPAPIYVLGPNEMVKANATATERPLADLTKRVA